jgi:stage II sporulation protein D
MLGDGLITSGTSFSICITNGMININGTEYQSVLLVPQSGSSTMTLDAGSISRTYMGNMEFKVSSENIVPINTLNIEDYLKGVVGYEMSNSYPIEALKAQAVAARNYALANIGKYGSRGYDVSDGTDCQVYKGYNQSLANVIRAVDETKGKVLLYGSTLIAAYYSADNGGYTEATENVWITALPYYIAQKDDYDDYTKYTNSRSYDWTRSYTAGDIDAKLKSNGIIDASMTFVQIPADSITRYPSGRVSSITIVYKDISGNQYTKSFTKEKARTFLSFPSGMYTMTYSPDTDAYVFAGHGAGHGIGMSQIGAQNRAKEGQTFDQILGFYYNGTYVRDSIALIDSFSVSSSTALTGDELTLAASGKGGSGTGYLYKYIVQKQGVEVYTRDYDPNPALSYVPENIGEYTVSLYMKDSLSKVEYDDQRALSFTVSGFGDVNLDNIVDIFDMVQMSKRMGETQGASTDWNYKCDLVKDGVIDIQDIAAASMQYNKIYN